MIKYSLLCAEDHSFEGWFRDSADYDEQAKKALIECPVCGNDEIRKAVMAPAIPRKSNARAGAIRGDILEAMHRARRYVEKNFDYVGEKFPEEARKIHYGESEARGIYGEASGKEVKELVDEGVQVAPLPQPAKKPDAAGPAKLPAPDKKLN